MCREEQQWAGMCADGSGSGLMDAQKGVAGGMRRDEEEEGCSLFFNLEQPGW